MPDDCVTCMKLRVALSVEKFLTILVYVIYAYLYEGLVNHFVCKLSFDFLQNKKEVRSIISKKRSSHKLRQLEFYQGC